MDDDSAGVVANMFTIRNIDLNNTAKFMGSSNMHAIAESMGAWSPKDGLLDFTKVFSDGEYAHKFYSGRRMWGAYRLLVSMAINQTNKQPTNRTNVKRSTCQREGAVDGCSFHCRGVGDGEQGGGREGGEEKRGRGEKKHLNTAQHA